MLEDIQCDRTRLANIQVPHVFARPAEGFSGNNLQAGKVDIALLEEFDVFVWKILADDSHEVHGAVEACGHASIRGGASQEVLMLLERGLDVIEGDRADN